MAKLIGVVYLGLAIVIFGLFPLIAWMFKIPYFKVFRMVWDLFLITFSTTSTETVLPQLMERMEKFGCSKRVVSFVIPAGLSLIATAPHCTCQLLLFLLPRHSVYR